MKTIKVPPTAGSIETVTAFFQEQLQGAKAPAKAIMQVNVAVDEILSNIVRYSGAAEISAGCSIGENCAILCFEDDGVPYDPTKTPEPDITLPIEERDIGGLGILMVRRTMNRMEYARSHGCNVLRLEKAW